MNIARRALTSLALLAPAAAVAVLISVAAPADAAAQEVRDFRAEPQIAEIPKKPPQVVRDFRAEPQIAELPPKKCKTGGYGGGYGGSHGGYNGGYGGGYGQPCKRPYGSHHPHTPVAKVGPPPAGLLGNNSGFATQTPSQVGKPIAPSAPQVIL